MSGTLATIDFSTEKRQLSEPGDLEYGGQVKIGNLTTPLFLFAITYAELNGKVVATSKDVVFPIGMPRATKGWEWWPPHPTVTVTGFPMGEYTGKIELSKGGNYKIYSKVYLTPLEVAPIAETPKVPITVGQDTFIPGDKISVLVPIEVIEGPASAEYEVIVAVHEGSLLATKGTLLQSLNQKAVLKKGPNEVKFPYVATATNNKRRDVVVNVYLGGEEVGYGEFDDVLWVEK